jgi:DNA-binding GntR family transcriptional regulator
VTTMRSRVIPRLGVAAMVVALLPAGAEATSTHDEYVAQVNPICKSATRQAKKIPDRIRQTGNPFIGSLLRAKLYAKLLKRTIRRIARVEPAPGEADAVNAWLGANRRTVRLIHGLLRAVDRGDAPRARKLIRKIVRSQRQSRKRAAALGLPACAKGPRPS